MSDIEVWIDDARGRRLALATGVLSVGVVRVANGVGAVAVALPGQVSDLPLRMDGAGQPQGLPLRVDGIVEVWRKADLTPAGVPAAPFPAGKGGKLQLVTAGFMRKFVYGYDSQGRESVIVSGPDAKDLLARRIVAFAAGTAQAQKHDYADDMLKEIITQNLGSSAVGGRNVSSYGLSVDPDLSKGPVITKGFAWRNVLRVCQDICLASAEEGTDLFFEMVPGLVSDNQLGFTFRTFTGQIGTDRTGVDQVVFGREFGNLGEATLEEDYGGEVNYVYAGGQGEESARLIEEAGDTVRIAGSVWNRREGFVDARSDALSAGLQAAAGRGLQEGRPVTRFSGKLLDTAGSVWMEDWDYGDRVMCRHMGREFEGMIRAVKWGINEGGVESVEARIEIAE